MASEGHVSAIDILADISSFSAAGVVLEKSSLILFSDDDDKQSGIYSDILSTFPAPQPVQFLSAILCRGPRHKLSLTL